MKKKLNKNFDVYMAKVRQAKELPEEKRKPADKKLLNFAENGPSFNSLFSGNRNGRNK